jgi:hypothetical protein
MPKDSKKSTRKRRVIKDRVLQARIPETLDDELRDRAEQLGLSVSTVVRNVLQNTFNLVEGVVADSAQIARLIKGDEPSTSPAPDDPAQESSVVAWQEAVLARNGICDSCNTILPAGTRASVAVPAQARPVLMCLDCLANLSKDLKPKGATS